MINIMNFFVDFESNILIYFNKNKLTSGIKELVEFKKQILESGKILIDNKEYKVNYIEILDKGDIFLFVLSIEMLKNDIRMVDKNYVDRIKFI